MKSADIYHYLDDDELLRISNKIKEQEKNTAGEICISIKEKRSLFDKNKDLKKLAEEEFFKRNIDKTRDKTGILIYILLSDRKFYILADSGINEKVEQAEWDNIKDRMQEIFMNGKFSKGIIYAVEEVGKILRKHFPVKDDDTNELPNTVVFD